jgi:DNA-binding transcriptional MerR regulator
VEKSPEAFRTISEVAEDLDLPQHVLRFWETRFTQIKPLKRGGGRRYYRPDDVDLLKGIRYYLYGEGYTIKGVQRILKDRGIKHVTEMGRAQNENYAPPVAVIPKAEDEAKRRERQDWPEALPPSQLKQRATEMGDAAPREKETFAREHEPFAGGAHQGRPPLPPRPLHASPPSSDVTRRLEGLMRELKAAKQILDSAR